MIDIFTMLAIIPLLIIAFFALTMGFLNLVVGQNINSPLVRFADQILVFLGIGKYSVYVEKHRHNSKREGIAAILVFLLVIWGLIYMIN